MGQFFLFLEQIAPSPAAHARTLLRGYSRMSRRGNGVRNSRNRLYFGPQLNAFITVGILLKYSRRKLLQFETVANFRYVPGVNSHFASVSESIFNGFLLKMLLRSLSVYILKQLFFSISVNSGRIFTSPLRGSVNILPLFTSISKNNC